MTATNPPLYAPETNDCGLTKGEITRLKELEGIVRSGLDAFLAVGQALLEIRERQLYRWGYDSFTRYCERQLGLTRSRAYQAIDYAQVSTTVDIDQLNERQARELAPLLDRPDQLREAAQLAQAIAKDTRVKGKPTAEDFRIARRKVEGEVSDEDITAKGPDRLIHEHDDAAKLIRQVQALTDFTRYYEMNKRPVTPEIIKAFDALCLAMITAGVTPIRSMRSARKAKS